MKVGTWSWASTSTYACSCAHASTHAHSSPQGGASSCTPVAMTPSLLSRRCLLRTLHSSTTVWCRRFGGNLPSLPSSPLTSLLLLFVLQYVPNPRLLNGRKFDLRLYAIVTQVDPLRVFLFQGVPLLPVSCSLIPSFRLLSNSSSFRFPPFSFIFFSSFFHTFPLIFVYIRRTGPAVHCAL